MDIPFQSIGTIHTPYFAFNTPHQPIPNAPGDFWITLNPKYASALKSLDSFNYIHVLYYLDQVTPPIKLLTHSPWAPELEIGLFASRSPLRPNPIGLSIVKLKEIVANELVISGIDAYNGTPLLDIKPYIHFRDSIADANNGWFDTLPAKEHTIAHALGLSHEHENKQEHEHPPHHNDQGQDPSDHHRHHDDHSYETRHDHAYKHTKPQHEHND